MLPTLSRQVRIGDRAGAMDTQNRAIEVSLLLTLPAAGALIAAGWPIVWTLFGRGAFDAESARATAWPTGCSPAPTTWWSTRPR
mgnify:CR=1 FL=1